MMSRATQQNHMVRYQVVLAYDGSEFFGFQRQGKTRTVQGEVEVALRRLGWQDRVILFAGRTDTGVHADGQVIAFDLDWRHPDSELLAALNAHLPADVAAQKICQVGVGFHPRYDAVARRYRYRLFCQPVRKPQLERYAWRVWPPVGQDVLLQAAKMLPGRRDFAAFGSPPRTGGSTIRTVLQAQWQAQDDQLIFEITADAFLYHMVRRLVQIQVDIGQGKLALANLQAGLAGVLPGYQGLAPARGLTLVEVVYPPAVQVG